MSQRRSLLGRLARRPSPALVVALVALFLAAGGVSYAAVFIPRNSISNTMLKNNSVGTVKLRQNAVTYQKIAPGSIGTVRIDKQEVQESINGACTTGREAITSIAETGTVTCGATLPSEYDSGAGSLVAVASPTVPATVASYSLPGGSPYMVQADPYITVTPDATGTGTDHVDVSCTLNAGTAATVNRQVTVDVAQGTGAASQSTSIPLMVTEPSSPTVSTADVTCTETSTGGTPTGVPTVKAQATVFALQTASNNSVATPAVAR